MLYVGEAGATGNTGAGSTGSTGVTGDILAYMYHPDLRASTLSTLSGGAITHI